MGDVKHGIKIVHKFAKAAEKFNSFNFAFKLQARDIDTFIHPDFKSRQDIKYVKRFSETRLTKKEYKKINAFRNEIINTFLPTVEGPNAIWYGNTVMELFTNLPEIIDKAVLSRVQEKFAIDGAKTWADFLDQDHLWWRKLQKLEPGFLHDLKDPENYVYLSAQKLVASIAETMTNGDEPTHEALKEIYCVNICNTRFWASYFATNSAENFPFWAERCFASCTITPGFRKILIFFQRKSSTHKQYLFFLSNIKKL